MMTTMHSNLSRRARIDWTLLSLWMVLMSIGVVMVASASVAFAAANYDDSWYFAQRHATYMGLAILLAGAVACVPMSIWQRYSGYLLVLTLLRSEEHTSELQSRENLVCRLLLEKKKKQNVI